MADQSLTKSEAMSRLQSYKARMSRIREEARGVTKRTVSTALGAGAGFGVGYVRAKYGQTTLPGTDVDADLVVGLLVSAAGITGMAGDQSDHASAVGTGILAGYAALYARDSATA